MVNTSCPYCGIPAAVDPGVTTACLCGNRFLVPDDERLSDVVSEYVECGCRAVPFA